MSENTKILVENMNLHYGSFHALKNINMEIPEKQITAFIGPSGCGKSTLLKSLNRMNDLVEGCVITGKVQLDGEDIYGDMDVNLLRKRVGMVFQKPNPFPMSIYDNIAYGPRTHGIRSRAKLDDIVEKSLRDAAIWDEVKDRLKKAHLECQVDSSSVFVLQELLRYSRKCFLWMSLLLHWTRFPHQKLRNWQQSLKRIIPLLW